MIGIETEVRERERIGTGVRERIETGVREGIETGVRIRPLLPYPCSTSYNTLKRNNSVYVACQVLTAPVVWMSAPLSMSTCTISTRPLETA